MYEGEINANSEENKDSPSSVHQCDVCIPIISYIQRPKSLPAGVITVAHGSATWLDATSHAWLVFIVDALSG